MSKLRKSARDRDCEIRVPNICNGDTETTVLCHIGGGGIGGKVSDIHGAFGCSACHDWVDGRTDNALGSDALRRKVYLLEAVIRTQEIWLREGLIKT